jgi:phage terminase large subunit
MLQQTTAQRKIAKLNKRVRIVRGGTSSSKTFTIIPLLITYCANRPNTEVSIVSETIPHLRRGALRDFLKIMDLTNNFNPDNYNKSTLTYTFSNGSYIEFFSADNPAKMRGARRDVLFINECNNVSWEAYHQLAVRTRNFIYLDYNPVSEFWVDTELINDKDSCYVVLTYKDNEALEPSVVAEIEKARERGKTSQYWANWWKVYGLGQVGSLQGVVFDNWQQVDAIPKDAKLKGYGMDFGYTNDPTTLIAIYEMDGVDYWDEVIYQTQLTNPELSKLMKANNVSQSANIYADSAEPKSIAELKQMGWRGVEGAVKGADSITFGIQRIQERTIKVTKRSLNIIKELRSYTWATDRDGKTLNKPIDAFNHSIDAIRYFYASERKNKGKYVVV